jgi:ComF family protein
MGAPSGRGIAFGTFGGALAVALRRLKYAERPDLAVPLGHLARQAARRAHLAGDVVVPVPLHPRRLAERGYNQAALLAAEVAVELAAPLAAGAIARVRNTPQQAQLDREARLHNVAQAFEVRAPRVVQGRRVVLVDDIATTGATLGACRSALLSAGASSVTALVVARAA